MNVAVPLRTLFQPALAMPLVLVALTLAQVSHAEALSVTLDDRQRVTVDAEDVRLSKLLREIARQADLELRLDPALDRRTTLATRNQTLDEFFNGLARRDRLNVMLAWSKPVAGVRRLTGVYVLKEGQTDISRLPPAALLAPGERKALREAQQAERRTARRAERGLQPGHRQTTGTGKVPKAERKPGKPAAATTSKPAARAPAATAPAKTPAGVPATAPTTGTPGR